MDPIWALLGGGLILYFLGFSSGWKRGRRELLVSLTRAQRIQKHLTKELR